MRTFATLKNFSTLDCKRKIVRNLNRILDIRILDLDAEKGTITFLCNTEATLDKVRRELLRIGCPINILQNNGSEAGIDHTDMSLNSTLA